MVEINIEIHLDIPCALIHVSNVFIICHKSITNMDNIGKVAHTLSYKLNTCT